MAGLNEIISPLSTQQHSRKSCQINYNPARCPPWLRDVRLRRTLMIAIDNLVNRSNLYQAAFLQKDRPIAHRLNQRIRMTGKHKHAGTLDEGLHASLGASCKSSISCTQPFIEQ